MEPLYSTEQMKRIRTKLHRQFVMRRWFADKYKTEAKAKLVDLNSCIVNNLPTTFAAIEIEFEKLFVLDKIEKEVDKLRLEAGKLDYEVWLSDIFATDVNNPRIFPEKGGYATFDVKELATVDVRDYVRDLAALRKQQAFPGVYTLYLAESTSNGTLSPSFLQENTIAFLAIFESKTGRTVKVLLYKN